MTCTLGNYLNYVNYVDEGPRVLNCGTPTEEFLRAEKCGSLTFSRKDAFRKYNYKTSLKHNHASVYVLAL